MDEHNKARQGNAKKAKIGSGQGGDPTAPEYLDRLERNNQKRAKLKRRIALPAWILSILAGINFGGCLLVLFAFLYQLLLALPALGMLTRAEWLRLILAGIACVIGTTWSGLIFHGTSHMKQFTSYKWAVAASILAIPTVVWAPIAIWCLVVLLQPETKKCYRQAR